MKCLKVKGGKIISQQGAGSRELTKKKGCPYVVARYSRKQTHQKDSVNSGVQCITPVGLRQSFFFSQGPQLTFVTTLYTLSVCALTHIPRFLKLAKENIRRRYNQVIVKIHNLKAN